MNDKEKTPSGAEEFVKGVKRRTRKNFSAEEKIRIVVEGMKRDVSVTELCRREGIPTAAYYSWTKDFMEGGKAQLQRDARRHADASGVEKLKKENAALRDLVADKEITIRIFKKTFGMEMALEKAESEGHIIDEKPTVLTDNGAGFSGEVMAKYLKARGVRHIFGAPYHPQTQGKVERFNRTMKEKVNLWVYTTPEDLQTAIDKMIEKYNETPHEALKNVCPNDAYAGRTDEVLERRAKIKLETLARRYAYNMGRTSEPQVLSGGKYSRNR